MENCGHHMYCCVQVGLGSHRIFLAAEVDCADPQPGGVMVGGM